MTQYKPICFPLAGKSLLSKYLTKEVYDEYRDKKTKFGVTIRQCINSGIENVDSATGVYAGDKESYTLFSKLFDPIVEEYHGHPKNAPHKADLDPSHLKAPNLDPKGDFIISTRIRVGRNFDNMPLGPAVTDDQRKDIERRAAQALKSLDGKLKGTYYPLNGMSPEVQRQLIADHFLFKEGDRFLETAGLNRDWPNGRGIFHNEDKTFLVWVNEEDQLRIISMQKGGDILEVFTRLTTAIAKMEKTIKFSFDNHLGYITSCPTNLGTALRGSVHIKVPLLAKNMDYFKSITDKHHLQIRGIHGEHSESVGGVYDISNKRRLGLSEVEAVQDMYNGVKELIAVEKSLQANLSFPLPGKSMLARYLTKDIYEADKNKQTKFGFTLRQAINSGIENPDSSMGVYAGDKESYTLFSKLFDPIIEEYHGHKKTDVHKADLNPAHLNAPNPDPKGEFIISTRIRVGRNFADMPLGPAITNEQRKEIEKRASDALRSMDGKLRGTYYPLNGMTPEVQKKLIADHFLFKEGDRFLETAGLNRDWPNGRGIFHNDDKTFLVWINEEDQLRIISMQKGGDILEVFTRLTTAIAKIEKTIRFSFDNHLGFITSCPSNLGTALRGSVHIKLPNLTKNMQKFKLICDKHDLQIRGIHGEHSESEGGIHDISNKRRLGVTEVQAVQDMYNGVVELIVAEKALQAKGSPNKRAVEHNPDVYPVFPVGSNSLMRKHLTVQVFEKLKHKKTQFGFTLWQAIRSGVENTDSATGVYAGDKETYSLFGKLFDPIVEEYHAYSRTACHKADLDPNHLNAPNPDPRGEFIVSTRIRVGRNFDGMPLGPALTFSQRKEIERRASEALKSLDGELRGNYYPLKGMRPEIQKQLIADHFLFKEGDRFLESAGLNRDWPEGRGIFHNDAKTFLVWVNEEDQLRIISMQKGGDILEVFTRLTSAIAKMEKTIKFSFDNHLGYITSCPTNLGTALRGSVHIAVPKLSKNWAKFQAITDKHHLQIRGIHGEHSESEGGVYDISNKRRLGLTEVEAVQGMYDGVVELIAAEKALR